MSDSEDFSDLKQKVSQKRAKQQDSKPEEDKKSGSLKGETAKGIISGFGKSGDSIVESEGFEDYTIFVKGSDTEAYASPKDIVSFKIVKQKNDSILYAVIKDIVEKNKESKNEMMRDIQDFADGEDDIVNFGKNGNRTSLSKKGAYKIRNYMAYLKRKEKQVEVLERKLDKARGDNDGR